MIRATVVLLMMMVASTAFAAEYDVVVYGGTGAGVTAAVQVARMGKRVALIEPGKHLGGLTSGGLGWTDIGNPKIVGGLSRDFYHRVWEHYRGADAWKQGTREDFAKGNAQGIRAVDEDKQLMWLFEPHVAEMIFDELVREAKVEVVLGERLNRSAAGGVAKYNAQIQSITSESGKTFAAKIFIDASYEGDLMAAAAVKYAVGREANTVYGETINGIQSARATKHQLPPGVDAFVIKGDRSSGLLEGVNPTGPGGEDGSGDDRIQAYCYRMCLTDVPENRTPIDKPKGYDEKRYELLFRFIEVGPTDRFFTLNLVPNRKTDSNNSGGVSTDLIGGNYAYPQADYAARDKIAKAHEDWQRGLLWTLQHHPRVPAEIRAKYQKWGLAKDEFTDTGNWPRQLYIREARRMLGQTIATERTLRDDSGVIRPIAMGAYTMDSHNVQRYADADGHVRNEGDVQVPVGHPYKIDYGTITPKPAECENLLVPVCLSASHIAYGSIRMEPVFMALGQSAGIAACLAIDGGTSVQNVPYATLRKELLAIGQVLE